MLTLFVIIPFLSFTSFVLFFFNDTATTEIYTLSLHDALPIWYAGSRTSPRASRPLRPHAAAGCRRRRRDRKSTRLNSSHQIISYAVFCLKKKKNKKAQSNTVLDLQTQRTSVKRLAVHDITNAC